jgi:hypothetical protein
MNLSSVVIIFSLGIGIGMAGGGGVKALVSLFGVFCFFHANKL